MAKSKKSQPRSRWTQEFRNIVAWVALIFLWILSFFWTKESLVWELLTNLLFSLFGEYFKMIFAPVLILLGVLIALHKIHWNYTRVVGLLLFWFSSDSLIWFISKSKTWLFDFSFFLEEVFSKTPSMFLVIWVLLLSLYLLFRISYIEVLKKVWSWLNQVKENVKEIRNDIAKDVWDKEKEKDKKKAKSEYKDEINMLNERINELSKNQTTVIL